MAVTAVATEQRWLGGGDVDVRVRLRNTGLRPVRVQFLSVLARGSIDSFGGLATSMDADRNGDPFNPDLLCTQHWLPWRSSATHTVRIHRAGVLPESLLVVAEVDGEREVLDVDLSRLSSAR